MNLSELYQGFDLDAPAIKAPLEPGIKPLCDALNALHGVHTLWSCEGHPEDGSRPYATFIAPRRTAYKIHRTINTSSELEFCWMMVATFRDDGSLQYTIEPNDYRISQGAWRWWWSSRRWSQEIMLADLARLAALVKTLP